MDSIQSTRDPVNPLTARGLDDTLAGALARRIRSEIIAGALQPGQRIRQDEYASALGMSKTPLREALKRLEAEGWLEIGPYRGAVVARATPEGLEQVYISRALHESFAAGLATERRTPQLLRRLGEIVQDMTSFTEKDIHLAEQLNANFHMTLYAGCGSEPLVRSLEDDWTRAQRFRTVYWGQAESWERSTRQHLQILRAVRAGHADKVEGMVIEHLLAGMDLINARIEGNKGRSEAVEALWTRAKRLRSGARRA